MNCSMPGFPVLYYLKLLSIELLMPSNHLNLCCLLLLLPSIFPSIRVVSNGQLFASGGQSIGASASASVLPMNIPCWFPLGLTGLISLLYTVVYICQSQSPNSSHPSPFPLGIHTFVFYVYSALFLTPFYVNSLFWSTQLLLWVGRSSPPDRPGSKGSKHLGRLTYCLSFCKITQPACCPQTDSSDCYLGACCFSVRLCYLPAISPFAPRLLLTWFSTGLPVSSWRL